jgi:hypothetical protein
LCRTSEIVKSFINGVIINCPETHSANDCKWAPDCSRNMTREVCLGANGDGKPVEEADAAYENEKDGGGEDKYSGGES